MIIFHSTPLEASPISYICHTSEKAANHPNNNLSTMSGQRSHIEAEDITSCLLQTQIFWSRLCCNYFQGCIPAAVLGCVTLNEVKCPHRLYLVTSRHLPRLFCTGTGSQGGTIKVQTFDWIGSIKFI